MNFAVMALINLLKIDMKFDPMEFINNIGYMGKGMLGIFIVMGIIVIATYLVNLLTSPTPNKKD